MLVFSLLNLLDLLILTDFFLHFIMCLLSSKLSYLFIYLLLSFFNLLKFLRVLFKSIVFARYAFLFFFIKKFFFFKKLFCHYIYIFRCIFLLFLTIVVVNVYLFLNLLNNFFNKDIFYLLLFDFVETFFVKNNVCNTLDFLRRKFPILSCFIFIKFHDFLFFKCFRFFYLYIRNEEIRQKKLVFTMKKLCVRVDIVRQMLFKCAYGGWSKYYDTFPALRSEVDIFDSLIKYYMISTRLTDKSLSYLALRWVWPELYSFNRLNELKKTMSLILFISHKRKYVNDDY